MRTVTLALPTFGFVVATRAALGAGVALLVADKLPAARRRVIGAALAAIGAAATIPAVVSIARGVRGAGGSAVLSEPRLIGATRFARKGDEPF